MRKTVVALAVALLAGLGVFAPAGVPVAHAASGVKVAIIVGATHSTTPRYRDDANEIYAEAIKYSDNVVKVYSPKATASKVKAAVNGASIVVYLGHGNGWPSPYTYDPNYTTKDGFGLNRYLNGDGKTTDYENKYYGEPWIRDLNFAPNAVVLLFHLSATRPATPSPATPIRRCPRPRSGWTTTRRPSSRRVPSGHRLGSQPRPLLHQEPVHHAPDHRGVLAGLARCQRPLRGVPLRALRASRSRWIPIGPAATTARSRGRCRCARRT